MQTLARLFGRSPFAPLQTHMAKVAICVDKIPFLFEALEKQEYHRIAELSEEISTLEHAADLTKNDIRNNLPTGLFLPIARASLLEILALQDTIADKAENIAVLLSLRNLELSTAFSGELRTLLSKSLETFHTAHAIIREMGELLESSFGGSEADKVRLLVEEVAFKEHEADLLQSRLLKQLFERGDTMTPPTFFLWMKVVQEIAAIANESEKLANRVRMTLEVK